MRGSVSWQTGELTKAIFEEGVSKEERTDPASEKYGVISSFKTMETYRDVWDDFGNWAKENLGLKDLEKTEDSQWSAFMEAKKAGEVSAQYMEKIASAAGAMERALERFTEGKYGTARAYDFSGRLDVLHQAKAEGALKDGYRDRAYLDPERVIGNLKDPAHNLAATVQREGGTRIEGISLVKDTQLRGLGVDKFTGREIGIIYTEEKGGKGGEVMMSPATYERLREHIEEHGSFEINQREYQRDVREAAIAAGEDPSGTHGFRWNYAQSRMEELQEKGKLTYDQARQQVSWEMKHERASITDHYLGR